MELFAVFGCPSDVKESSENLSSLEFTAYKSKHCLTNLSIGCLSLWKKTWNIWSERTTFCLTGQKNRKLQDCSFRSIMLKHQMSKDTEWPYIRVFYCLWIQPQHLLLFFPHLWVCKKNQYVKISGLHHTYWSMFVTCLSQYKQIYYITSVPLNI